MSDAAKTKCVVLNDDNFAQEVLQSNLPVLVDFWAPWCGPCRMVGPMVEELAVDFAGKAKVGKFNVDESNQIPAQYNVASIPTLLIFKQGKQVDQLVGAVSKKVLAGRLQSQLS